MMKRNDPIDRKLGTKKSCIADLRRAIALATAALDTGGLHIALHHLEAGIVDVKKKLPAEKITKPFKR